MPIDRRLAVATAPTAVTVRIVHAPVEDVLLGHVVVPHLDLDDAVGNLEVDEHVIEATRGHLAIEHQRLLTGFGDGGHEERERDGDGREERADHGWAFAHRTTSSSSRARDNPDLRKSSSACRTSSRTFAGSRPIA